MAIFSTFAVETHQNLWDWGRGIRDRTQYTVFNGEKY